MSTETGTFYQFTVGGGIYTPGILTHADITLTLFTQNVGFSVVNLVTDCDGKWTYPLPAGTTVSRRSKGKWVLSGGAYRLDTASGLRDGCCGSASSGFFPPDQSNLTNLVANDQNGVVCYALISGVPKTCAGISVILTDACGHTLTGTTRFDGFVVIDGTGGQLAISSVKFDWSQITAAQLTAVPAVGAFVNVPSLSSADKIVFPYIDPTLYTVCLCGSGGGPQIDLNVTGYYGLGTNTATNPSNLHHPFTSGYGRFAATSSGIQFWRSDFPTPAFALSASPVTTGASDADPHGAYDRRLDRLWCAFTRAGAGQVAYSDDDGETWNTPTTAPGKYPRVVVDNYTGDMLIAGVSGGNIRGTFQAMGETAPSASAAFLDTTGTAISVEDDSFDIVKLNDFPGRYAGIWRVLSSGVCSVWLSGDEGQTWEKQYDCLTGGTRPRLAYDEYTGDLMALAYVSGNIKAQFQPAGSSTAGAVFTLKDQGGTAILVQNTSFDVSKAMTEGPSRWVLTAMVGSDTTPSEWFSADDDAGTYQRVG